jgi:uncharacterized RDD family membrane protein YckC
MQDIIIEQTSLSTSGTILRRFMAFCLDQVIIAGFVVLAAIIVLILGIPTLGAAWLLFALPFGFWIFVACLYAYFTLGSHRSATLGMRAFELEMRTVQGEKLYGLLGVFHYILFLIITALSTPLFFVTCLVPFFNAQNRTLHDIFSGTLMVNQPR